MLFEVEMSDSFRVLRVETLVFGFERIICHHVWGENQFK